MSQSLCPRTCRHCGELFKPAPCNRNRQRFCNKPGCRRASSAYSRQLWLRKNPHHFEGEANVIHVRQWREAHPGYSRKKQAQTASATTKVPAAPAQKANKAQPPTTRSPDTSPAPLQENWPALQEIALRNPLIFGMLSELIGSTLQENLFREMNRLIFKGQEILGINPEILAGNVLPAKHHAKKNANKRAGPGRAAPVTV